MEDGEDKDEELNERYWDIKNGPAIRITSGFRVWKNKDDASPEWKADAAEISYQFFDFDEKKEDIGDKDGAAALASVAIAALAALLFA